MPRHEYCTVTMAHARNDRFIVTRRFYATWRWIVGVSKEQDRFDRGEGTIFLRSLRVSSINFELTFFFFNLILKEVDGIRECYWC